MPRVLFDNPFPSTLSFFHCGENVNESREIRKIRQGKKTYKEVVTYYNINLELPLGYPNDQHIERAAKSVMNVIRSISDEFGSRANCSYKVTLITINEIIVHSTTHSELNNNNSSLTNELIAHPTLFTDRQPIYLEFIARKLK